MDPETCAAIETGAVSSSLPFPKVQTQDVTVDGQEMGFLQNCSKKSHPQLATPPIVSEEKRSEYTRPREINDTHVLEPNRWVKTYISDEYKRRAAPVPLIQTAELRRLSGIGLIIVR
jgi:hypothetical protein